MSALTTDQRVQIIKALAHPARLEIAELLASGERCVTDLQTRIGGDISTVSKHLALMRKAGWIDCEKRAQQVYYRLACDCLPDFLHCVENIGKCKPSCDC